jgi:murein DD-endopeptidase MepM/ murein hydrolase activator NlpD
MKSGNQALIAAVFLVVGGLFSGVWLAASHQAARESGTFSAPTLVQTAQAQDSLPVVSAVGSGALADSLAIADANTDGTGFADVYVNGAIEDPESSIGSGVVGTNAVPGGGAKQLARQSEALPAFNKEFIIPAKGHNLGILRDFNGTDIMAACGTPVVAAADGLVVPDTQNQDISGNYGNFILLEHSFGDGVFTRYAHLEQSSVKIGDYVKQGQQIGLVGKTGDATACGLRFEVIGAQNPFARK